MRPEVAHAMMEASQDGVDIAQLQVAEYNQSDIYLFIAAPAA
jgi:hypothetical protein